jgi:gas vesicle protein
MNDRVGFLFIGILAGLVTGAAVALLASPASGTENRRAIKDFVNKTAGRYRDIPEKLEGVYNQVSESAKEAIRRT